MACRQLACSRLLTHPQRKKLAAVNRSREVCIVTSAELVLRAVELRDPKRHEICTGWMQSPSRWVDLACVDVHRSVVLPLTFILKAGVSRGRKLACKWFEQRSRVLFARGQSVHEPSLLICHTSINVHS